MKPSSIEIANALNTLQNLGLFYKVGNDLSLVLQRFKLFHVPDAARNLSSILILSKNKISITVKISIYCLSPTVSKTYESQYRSKYSISFTQRFLKGNNLELFQKLSQTFFLVPWKFEIADVHCRTIFGYRDSLNPFSFNALLYSQTR